jgi:hypothetical protein
MIFGYGAQNADNLRSQSNLDLDLALDLDLDPNLLGTLQFKGFPAWEPTGAAVQVQAQLQV